MQKIETGIWQMDDGRYRVRTTAKDESGRIVQREATTTTLLEARTARSQLKTGIRATRREVASGGLTLRDYCDWWIKRKAKRVKRSTLVKDIQVLGRFVLPELGHIPLQAMTRRDLSEWLRWAESQKDEHGQSYSDAYVKSWWRVLKPMLLDAHAHGHMPVDITSRQESPRTDIHGRQEKKTLSRQALEAYLETFQKFYPERYAEVLMLARTGMRPGELYGLQWSDLDFDGRQVVIERRAYRGEINTTKTSAPRRAPLTSDAIEALQAHRKDMMVRQAPGFDSGVVFPASNGNRRDPSSLRKPMELVAEHLNAKQRVTPQVLRRTLITLMVEAGVDRIVIRSIVGHSSEEMTERYTGVRLDQKHEAMEMVDRRAALVRGAR
jgi:integrase